MFRDFKRDLRIFPDARTWSTLIGAPYITVSAKGIANGKSTVPNGGADFGPDTPGTTTLGVQEAFNYAVANYSIPTQPAFDNTPSALPILFEDNYFILPNGAPANVTFPVISGGPYDGVLPSFYIRGFASGIANATVLWNYNITFGNANASMPAGGFYIGYINFRVCTLNFPASGSYDPNIIFDTVGGAGNNIMMTGPHIAQLTLKNLYNLSGTMFVNTSYQIIALDTTIKNGLYLANINQIGGLGLSEAIGITAGNFILNLNTWEIDDHGGVGTPVINNTAGGTTSKAHFEVGTCILSAGSSSSYKPFFANTLQSSYPNISGFDSTTQGTLEVYMHIHKLQLDAYTDFTPPSGITVKEFKVDEIINNSGQDISTLLALEGSVVPALAANPPVSGTVYQNTNPYAIEIDLPVYATTSGTAGTVAYGVSSSSTVTEMTPEYVSGDTSSGAVDIVKLEVPAWWYYEYTYSGVTAGTAVVHAR